MNITNNKGIIISHSCERVNSKRRSYNSNHYFNAFVRDAIEQLKRGRTYTVFTQDQLNEIASVLPINIKVGRGYYLVRKI